MTDTTNTTPVLEETEMSKIQDFLQRAANTIVQASELSKEVQSLREQVEKIKGEIETLQRRNEFLDTALVSTREQRDQAYRERDEARRELEQVQRSAEMQSNDLAVQINTVHNLRQTLVVVTKERDEYFSKAVDAEDALAKANARLAQIGQFFKEAQPPQPVPAPVSEQVQPKPEPELPTELHHPDRMAQGSGF